MGLGLLNPGCGCCIVCEGCAGAMPDEVDVAISGAATGSCADPNCLNWDTTVTCVSRIGVDLPCEYRGQTGFNITTEIQDGSLCSEHPGVVLVRFYKDGTDHKVEVRLIAPDFTGEPVDTHYFIYNFGATAPDCEAISGLVVPFDHEDCRSGTCSCTLNGCTVTITAIP
jgi:hypothetical protein